MLSDDFINYQKQELIELGSQLQKEAHFATTFIDKSCQPENEKKWFNRVRDVSIHGTFSIQNLIYCLDRYKKFKEDQIGFYIAKVAITPFLEIINAFEASTRELINTNDEIKELLEVRVKKRVDIINNCWDRSSNSKSRKLKDDLIVLYSRKKHEMNFIRETMKKESIINDLDKKILDFSWDVRNSMHNNFVAMKDISFSAPGTSLSFSFDYKKDQELDHQGSLLSYYQMYEQIIFIQHKILQYFNKK